MVQRIAVVTDSTASLPREIAEDHDITVVPLQVVIGADSFDEGSAEATPEKVAEALKAFKPVSTSRPAPALFMEVYDALAAEGAEAIVSIHLSGEMSGTFESAQLAARKVSVPVTAVDSRQVGIATGFAALRAVERIAAGADAAEAATAARDRAQNSTSLFYVDTLEYLRRGGRIGAAAAIFGGALAVKPLLAIVEGKVENREKVRTAAKALARLEDRGVEAGEGRPVDVAVSHLANPDRAATLTQHLEKRLADELEGRPVICAEVGAVLGAHVGPGMVAVTVSPR